VAHARRTNRPAPPRAAGAHSRRRRRPHAERRPPPAGARFRRGVLRTRRLRPETATARPRTRRTVPPHGAAPAPAARLVAHAGSRPARHVRARHVPRRHGRHGGRSARTRPRRHRHLPVGRRPPDPRARQSGSARASLGPVAPGRPTASAPTTCSGNCAANSTSNPCAWPPRSTRKRSFSSPRSTTR
jgi:hypothetical protein